MGLEAVFVLVDVDRLDLFDGLFNGGHSLYSFSPVSRTGGRFGAL
jgi:hypothetical protein